MALEIDRVDIGDLIRELNPEALQYFAGIELSGEWPSYTTALSGKFIRLGEVVLLGATIDYGRVIPSRGDRKRITHLDMLWYGCQNMGEDVATRIRETAPDDGKYLKGKRPLVDAGHSIIQVDGDSQPSALALDDRSFDYGRPDQKVRQRTGEIARLALGADFPVTVK